MALHSDDPFHPVLIDSARESRFIAELKKKEAAYPVLTKTALEAAGEDSSLWYLSAVNCSATLSGGYWRQMPDETAARELALKLNSTTLYATHLTPHTYQRGRIVWARVT